MDAFELTKLIDESIEAYEKGDLLKSKALNNKYLAERGMKFTSNGQGYFTDEHGDYYPTESGRAVYF